jgi:hypothetical protein
MDRTIPKELNLHQLVLDKTRELKNPPSMKKHLILIDEENLQKINQLIEQSEKKREQAREKYIQKNKVEESDFRKKKDPITYKIITTF